MSVESLEITYMALGGRIKAVDGISFSLEQGEWMTVVGESGSGKSTLAYAIMRLVPPPGKITGGKIVFDGMNLLELDKEKLRKIRGKEIAMVFQDPMTSLDPLRRVGDQAAELFVEHEGLDMEEAKKRAEEAMRSVRLPQHVLNSYPHQLSGGQRQRVMIAMAMSLRPKLLIADEPTTALDVLVQEGIMELLNSMKEEGTSILLITHDLSLAANWSDRIMVMYAGRLAELGNTEDLVERPLHPYTKGLLDSVPDLWSDKEVKPIEGNPPDMRYPPPGCRFHPRCPMAMEICSKKEPPILSIDKRIVSCWLMAKEGGKA
ncbi:MAG: ATP-binding cassette domain-containing protein [Desulfurococcales archaeon]|jgi:peptide/nickel transport system ATP-binding protein|nr:ATP-binding cassette domain-containing protein [Desulfurococcales archaeon]